jgi:hypothetical protein
MNRVVKRGRERNTKMNFSTAHSDIDSHYEFNVLYSWRFFVCLSSIEFMNSMAFHAAIFPGVEIFTAKIQRNESS